MARKIANKARKIRNKALDSRDARLKLTPRGTPYRVKVGPKIYLAYRRLDKDRDGTVAVHRYTGKASCPYETVEKLGALDDYNAANGETVLDYWQAVAKAREVMNEAVTKAPAAFTVAAAVELYLTDIEAEGRDAQALADIRSRLEKFVLKSSLAGLPIEQITTEQYEGWRLALVTSKPQKRTGAGKEPAYRDWQGTDDQKRARRATATRLWATFKAVLNHAFHKGKVSSDAAWKRVKPLKSIEKARDRALTLSECQRLINGADTEFRPMIQAGLLTGSRYGSLAKLRVKDFDPDAGTLRLTTRKGNRGLYTYYAHLNEEGQTFFRAQCARRSNRNDHIFLQDSGRPWGRSDQQNRTQEACERVGISPVVTFYFLRHTYISLSIMAGMSETDVAANVATSPQMIHKHYAHLAPSHRRQQVQQFAPQFGIDLGNVTVLSQ
jgi:integrase